LPLIFAQGEQLAERDRIGFDAIFSAKNAFISRTKAFATSGGNFNASGLAECPGSIVKDLKPMEWIS